MKQLSRYLTGLASLLLLFSGCMTPRATINGKSVVVGSPEWFIHLEPTVELSLDPTIRRVWVVGFVKRLGPFRFKDGMKLGDALTLAGGYNHCTTCEADFKTTGSQVTYRHRPEILRKETKCNVPRKRSDWLKFKLEPDDKICFFHIMF